MDPCSHLDPFEVVVRVLRPATGAALEGAEGATLVGGRKGELVHGDVATVPPVQVGAVHGDALKDDLREVIRLASITIPRMPLNMI